MQLYRTIDCPGPRRTAYWNDIYTDRFAHVTFSPIHTDFAAELRMSSLGPLGMADIRTSSADVERTASHIDTSKARLFSFLLLAEGSATFSHYGHEERLEAGDFTLCDNAAPHRIHFEANSRLMLLRVSPEILRSHLPCPEQLCGLQLPAAQGLTPTVSLMAQSIWQQLEAGLDDTYRDRIADHLLAMVSTAYLMGLGHRMTNSTVVGLRKARARRFIESNLSDPDLSAASIADGLRISTRYLRMLFAEDEENVSAYILRRRLEQCASEIASSGWRHLTITELAFRWGFNSSAYFARAFRQRFGMTASEYRRLKSAH